jgi:hypothetical protein
VTVPSDAVSDKTRRLDARELVASYHRQEFLSLHAHMPVIEFRDHGYAGDGGGRDVVRENSANARRSGGTGRHEPSRKGSLYLGKRDRARSSTSARPR